MSNPPAGSGQLGPWTLAGVRTSDSDPRFDPSLTDNDLSSDEDAAARDRYERERQAELAEIIAAQPELVDQAATEWAPVIREALIECAENYDSDVNPVDFTRTRMEAGLRELLRSVAEDEPSIAAFGLWRIDPTAVTKRARPPVTDADAYHRWLDDCEDVGETILDAVVEVVVRDLPTYFTVREP